MKWASSTFIKKINSQVETTNVFFKKKSLKWLLDNKGWIYHLLKDDGNVKDIMTIWI